MWQFLNKKCKCEDTPTNEGVNCNDYNYFLNNIISCNLFSCIDINEGDDFSIIIQKIDNFICGVGLTQYILDLIQNNPSEYSEFIQLINDVIDCDVINQCLVTTTTTSTTVIIPTTTTTTTINLCDKCEIIEVEMTSFNGSEIKNVEVNNQPLNLTPPTTFPITDVGEGFIIRGVQSSFEIAVTVTAFSTPSSVKLLSRIEGCSFEFCQDTVIGTFTYIFPGLNLACNLEIITEDKLCEETTTTTSTTEIITTTTTTTIITTTTTTTIITYRTMQLNSCGLCDPDQPTNAFVLLPDTILPGAVVKTTDLYCWTVFAESLEEIDNTFLELIISNSCIDCQPICPIPETCYSYRLEYDGGPGVGVDLINCDGIEVFQPVLGTVNVCARQIIRVVPSSAVVFIENLGNC